MSPNRPLPLILDELIQVEKSLPREGLHFAASVVRLDKAPRPVSQEDVKLLEEIERFQQVAKELVIRLEALIEKAKGAFPTNPLPVEFDGLWRPVISLVKYGRTDYRRYTQTVRGFSFVGGPGEWIHNDRELLIGILQAAEYSALKDFVCRMMRVAGSYGGLHLKFSQSPKDSEGSDYVNNWIPQLLRRGRRYVAQRAVELFPVKHTKRWSEWSAREFRWCMEERNGRTKFQAWEHFLESCASEASREFRELIERELTALRLPEPTLPSADLPAFVADFGIRLRLYATMMDHLAEIPTAEVTNSPRSSGRLDSRSRVLLVNGNKTARVPNTSDRVNPEGQPNPSSSACEELDDLVTLSQAAALARRSKRTLERYLQNDELPVPDSPGGAGHAHKWRWNNLRPALEKVSRTPLPEKFPASRII